MSRSFRKHPSSHSHKSGNKKWHKRQAAKAVRRSDEVPVKGFAFAKRLYDPWKIVDYKWVCYCPIHAWRWDERRDKLVGAGGSHSRWWSQDTYDRLRRK
jgi:hypothetical protein